MLSYPKDKKRVSELFFYIRDTIDDLRSKLIEDNLSEKDRLIYKSQLDILMQVKSVCDKRDRY